MGVVVVASVCFVRDGSLLTVRKRGAARFMLPGGKLEPGETSEQAARREVREEVGVEAGPLELLGEFEADAANEPGDRVVSTTYLDRTTDPGDRHLAEIAETRWLRLHDPLPDDLAPLLVEHVVPLLRGLLRDQS